MAYKEFDDASYTALRRSLLRTKGGGRQREFLQAVRDSRDFLAFLQNEVSTTGELDAPLFSVKLTEDEFKEPPSSTEAELYDCWNDLTPRIACRTAFWANLTCRHVESGAIDSVYLAANGGSLPGGAERVDRALRSEGDNALTGVDQCVRTVLRRLGGLRDARGNRTVYVDCPFARAWWRERLVSEVCSGDRALAGKIRKVVRINQTYWERLVVMVVSRNSVLGSDSIRDAFILSLADFLSKNPDTPLGKANQLQLACRLVGAAQASRELGILEKEEIREFMDRILAVRHQHAIATAPP